MPCGYSRPEGQCLATTLLIAYLIRSPSSCLFVLPHPTPHNLNYKVLRIQFYACAVSTTSTKDVRMNSRRLQLGL
jgi:hypothetical protein